MSVEQENADLKARIQSMAETIVALEAALVWTHTPTPHPEFLRWIADRLVNVYGESENVDYVLSLRMRADAIEKALNGHPLTCKAMQ